MLEQVYITYDTFFNYINLWLPYFGFMNEVYLLQFLILYLFLIFYWESNPYYNLLYMFILIFIIGIFLGFYQLEIFTAFLWLIECSVIFVMILILLYVNIKGIKVNYNRYYNLISLFIFFFFLLINYYIVDLEFDVVMYDFISPSIYDNLYELLNNDIMNDLFGFYISYYILNVVVLIIIGYILLVGSVLCVNLFKLNKNIRSTNYNEFFNIFSIFFNLINYNFFRKQNLIIQGNTLSSIKVFKKKL